MFCSVCLIFLAVACIQSKQATNIDYEQFIENIQTRDTAITKIYPNKNKVTGKFFPPKGNDIEDGEMGGHIMKVNVNLWYKVGGILI